jgi:acetoin utilization deacetylase AcuC-like enzyme
MVIGAGRPTLVVQEGGYNLRNLRKGASAFFRGMAAALGARAG